MFQYLLKGILAGIAIKLLANYRQLSVQLLQIEAATVWNNRVVQNQRLVFDPSRSDALVSSELSFPDSNGQLAVRLRWEVTDWRQLAPTVWIPTKWTSEMTPAFGNPEPVRLTYQTERVAHFSANDAAVIFSAADVTINKSVAYPSTGPSLQYSDVK